MLLETKILFSYNFPPLFYVNYLVIVHENTFENSKIFSRG